MRRLLTSFPRLRNTRKSVCGRLLSTTIRRQESGDTRRPQGIEDEAFRDPRPRWLFTASGVLRVLCVPGES